MHAVTLGVNNYSDLNNSMTATPPNPAGMMVDPMQLQQLVQLLGKNAAPKQTAVVECPKTMVGRVIGKGGETIKSLQQYTGAMIQIDQSTDPTRVTIAGSPQSLQLAVSMVNDIVRGTFKGFAMLRQIAIACSQPGVGEYGQPQPIYVQGYGFVPPSQVFNPDDPLAAGMAQHLSPTGPLTPPMTPMRSGMANNMAGGLSADAIAALLAGNVPPQGQPQMQMPQMPQGVAGPSQDALLSHLLSQMAAQQAQASQMPESSGLDQATIQTMLAQAGLMGAGQAAAASAATPGMAKTIGPMSGLPPSTSLMLSAQGTPAVLGNQSPYSGPPSVGGTMSPPLSQVQPGTTSPLMTSFTGTGNANQQGQGGVSFLGTSPSSISSPPVASGRASPSSGGGIYGLTAANPALSQPRPRPNSGDSSPLGRYGAIGSSVSPVSHIGAAAEEALALRMGNISTSDDATEGTGVGGGVNEGGGGVAKENSGNGNNANLLPGWIKVSDPQGLTYYVNPVTNESSFLPPTTASLAFNNGPGSM